MSKRILAGNRRRSADQQSHGLTRCRSALTLERLEDRRLLAADLEHQSVARLWNEALLDAIRVDTPRPTVHARNLFHTSVAMYDAWAAFDPHATGYLIDESATDPSAQAFSTLCASEAISYAAYRLLTYRFEDSPGAATSLASFDALMDDLGYDRGITSTEGNSPAAIGNRIAAAIIEIGLSDGSNEMDDYLDTSGYAPTNAPMDVTASGTELIDPNHWQPLVVDGSTQKFLTPHWGDVDPFAMTLDDASGVYHDPGAPPQLGGDEDAEFKDALLRVIRFSSQLDPTQEITIDISPSVTGNNALGTNDGTGHSNNPATGLPYEPNLVNQADWARVLAEFWADGPNSETPPGHWNTIANYVTDEMEELGIPKRVGIDGRIAGDLEWDVELYLALNGALHDAAIAAWDAKAFYDYVRPISMIRYMGGLGQSSNPDATSYDPMGLPLEPGLVEVITTETTSEGQRHDHLTGHEGEIAIYAWAGHPSSADDIGGVEWILAEDWLPYQAENFITPAFAGFVSGHSAFSRAAAEVLTLITGDPFFPGGMGTFLAPAGDFLDFETGPTETFELQWATYYDASDEAGLSRLYGGIHVDADDFDGRIIGSQVGITAFEKAESLFNRHDDGDSGSDPPTDSDANHLCRPDDGDYSDGGLKAAWLHVFGPKLDFLRDEQPINHTPVDSDLEENTGAEDESDNVENEPDVAKERLLSSWGKSFKVRS